VIAAAALWAAWLAPPPEIPPTGVVRLPAGVIELARELAAPAGARDLEIRGAPEGTVLRAAAGFRGRALLVIARARNVRVVGLALEGNRSALARPQGLPPSDVPFCRFTANNGLLAEDVEGLYAGDLRLSEIAGFAVLAARSRGVRIERLEIRDSGSLDAAGRNNTTGGILLEEGVADFTVRDCRLERVRGNGIWTHSLYSSPRNRDGLIAGNFFQELARDAIQIGHATRVRVEHNRGRRIGYPTAEVDPQGTPVALDTAGNTESCAYAFNRFEEVNGKCIDLDGFHHGEVRGNLCRNRGRRETYPHGHFGIVFNNSNPDMRPEGVLIAGNEIDGAVFGGLFLIGSGHRVTGNRLLRLNLAGCEPRLPACLYWPEEPELLSAGIYLGRRAERPAVTRDNVIRDNLITGYGMSRRCIAAAPGVALSANRVGPNRCAERPDQAGGRRSARQAAQVFTARAASRAQTAARSAPSSVRPASTASAR